MKELYRTYAILREYFKYNNEVPPLKKNAKGWLKYVRLLAIHPYSNKYNLSDFLHCIYNGFTLGYDGTLIRKPLNIVPINYVDSRAQFLGLIDKVIAKLTKYQSRPYNGIVEFVSRLTVRPKTNNRWRLINDGSTTYGHQLAAINDGINKDNTPTSAYPKQYYAEVMVYHGKGFIMLLKDLQEAFYQLHCSYDDARYLCSKICGLIMNDGVLGMGMVPSPGHQQRLSDIVLDIIHVLAERDGIIAPGERIGIVTIDDFLFIGKDERQINALDKLFTDLLPQLGLECNHKKTIGPDTTAVVIGIEFRSTDMKAAITKDKRDWIINACKLLKEYRWVQVKCFGSILGKIMNIAEIFDILKPLIYGGIVWLYTNIQGYSSDKRRNKWKQQQWIYLPDIVVMSINQIQFLLEQAYEPIDLYILAGKLPPVSRVLHIWTDACKDKFGFIVDGVYYYDYCPSYLVNSINQLYAKKHFKKIHIKEAWAILQAMHAIKSWTSTYDPHSVMVMVHCDNTVVVASLKRNWSKNIILLAIIFEIKLLCFQRKLLFKIKWVSTDDNVIADALSRGRVWQARQRAYELKVPFRRAFRHFNQYTRLRFIQ